MTKYFIFTAFIAVTAFAFIASGCGKSGKEVKTSEKQSASDNKTGKVMTVDIEKRLKKAPLTGSEKK